MKITRREFLPTLGLFIAGAAIPNTCGSKNESKNEIKEEEKPPNKQKTIEELNKLLENDSSVIKTLRWVDPNLSNIIIDLLHFFTEPLIFHKINYEKFKKGIGNISEADLIHNNSDRWANAMSCTISYFIAYSARFPFTAWIASDSSESSIDEKRANRVFSDFMTINAYYGQTFADRFLTNVFQHELRQAFKKLLKENPQYEYQPWKIPLKKTIATIQGILPVVTNSVSSEIKTGVSNLQDLANEKSAKEWIKSRKNQLNLLLVFLSYISTFVDVVPLVTADKVKAYTANTATGRMMANLPCQAILCTDLLKRLKAKGDLDGYNEEKVMASAGLYNGPIYFVINSSIQSFVDSFFNFKKYSDKEVAYSNLREIIGAVAGSIIFSCLQYKLESSIRSNTKDFKEGLTDKNALTRFAKWYIEPTK